MVSRGVAKLSISLPKDLARTLRRVVGPLGWSAFTARGLRRELERERLSELIDQLDADLGPVPEMVMRDVRAAWRK